MKTIITHANEITGCYWPTDVLNERIDWILREIKGGGKDFFHIGQETPLKERDKNEIVKHIRRAVVEYLSNPRKESRPVKIWDIK